MGEDFSYFLLPTPVVSSLPFLDCSQQLAQGGWSSFHSPPTPVGRSRQSSGASHWTQVCRNPRTPAPITSSWHQSQPPPGCTELPPQESPPIFLGGEPATRREPESTGAGASPSDLLPRTKTGVPSLLTSKGLPWPSPPPHRQKKASPSSHLLQVPPLCLFHGSSFLVSPFDS